LTTYLTPLYHMLMVQTTKGSTIKRQIIQ